MNNELFLSHSLSNILRNGSKLQLAWFTNQDWVVFCAPAENPYDTPDLLIPSYHLQPSAALSACFAIHNLHCIDKLTH